MKVIGLLLLLLISQSSYSACSIDAGQQNILYGFIQAQFSVGDEKPNGYSILNQSSRPATNNQTVTCDSSGKIYMTRDYEPGATLIPTGLTGSYGGDVYETIVPGLGFYFFSVEKPIGSTNTSNICTGNSCIIVPSQSYLGVRIVKTGSVAPGATLSGSDLPCVLVSAGMPGSMAVAKKLCLSGTITITNFTCTTPSNINVSLGTYDKSKFTGVNTASEWVDASIHLTNCPPSYGLGVTGIYNSDHTVENQVVNQNALSLSLSPVNGAHDAGRGIINLDNASSASGVRIQIATDDGHNIVPVDFNNAEQLNIPISFTNMVNSLTIPLNARYIQTDEMVSPGSADSQMIYTINYQ